MINTAAQSFQSVPASPDLQRMVSNQPFSRLTKAAAQGCWHVLLVAVLLKDNTAWKYQTSSLSSAKDEFYSKTAIKRTNVHATQLTGLLVFILANFPKDTIVYKHVNM